MKRQTWLVGVVAAVLWLVSVNTLGAQPIDLARYAGRESVILILAESRDDTRTFEFNLAASLEWNRLEARRITTLDVDPTRHDMEAAFEQLEIARRPFLIVLVGRRGEIIETSEDPASLSRLLMAYDLHVEANPQSEAPR